MSVFAEVVLVIALIFTVLMLPSFWSALRDLVIGINNLVKEIHSLREEIKYGHK